MGDNSSLYSIKSVCQLEEDEFEAVFEFDSDTPLGLRFERLTCSLLTCTRINLNHFHYSEEDLLTLELLKNENLLVIKEDEDQVSGILYIGMHAQVALGQLLYYEKAASFE